MSDHRSAVPVPRWAWAGLLTALTFLLAATIQLIALHLLATLILAVLGLLTGCITLTAYAWDRS